MLSETMALARSRDNHGCLPWTESWAFFHFEFWPVVGSLKASSGETLVKLIAVCRPTQSARKPDLPGIC